MITPNVRLFPLNDIEQNDIDSWPRIVRYFKADYFGELRNGLLKESDLYRARRQQRRRFLSFFKSLRMSCIFYSGSRRVNAIFALSPCSRNNREKDATFSFEGSRLTGVLLSDCAISFLRYQNFSGFSPGFYAT